MEKYIVEEIAKELKWNERMVVRLFKKVIIKVYKIGISFGYNIK